jgi:hypothetical protein
VDFGNFYFERGLRRGLMDDGEISRKHGNTLVRTLRKMYGAGFAPGFKDTDKLSDVLRKFNEPTLTQLRRDHEMGALEQKLAHNK